MANEQLGTGAGATASETATLGHCDRIEELVIYPSEAHALGEDPAAEEEILKLVCTARTKVQKGESGAAQEAVTLAYCRLRRATVSQGKWWSFNMQYAGPMWLYFGAVLGVLWFVGCHIETSGMRFFDVPVSMAGYGVLGGVLRGMYWLYQKVQRGEFRVQFVWPYLACPWTGGVFGALAYAVFASGAAILGNVSASGTDAEGPSTVGLALVAMLAGFSWKWMIDLLDRTKKASG